MKKLIAGIAVGILLGSLPVVFALSTFSDVPSDAWYASAVYSLRDKGIIGGYKEDNTFRPGNPVTRGEIAVMLNKLLMYLEKAN